MGDISSSDEDVDKGTFSQIKKWLKEMEKKNEELKTALALKEDLLRH